MLLGHNILQKQMMMASKRVSVSRDFYDHTTMQCNLEVPGWAMG